MESAAVRANELGAYGHALLRFLPPSEVCDDIAMSNTDAQWHMLGSLGTKYGYISQVACSLLVCNTPFQVMLHERHIVELLHLVKPVLTPHCEYDVTSPCSACIELDSLGRVGPGSTVLAFKGDIAHTKCNIAFSDAWVDLCNNSPAIASQVQRSGRALHGCYNDQGTAIIMYTAALFQHLKGEAFPYSYHFVRNPHDAKAFSTILKAMGANATPLGSVLTEANTLTGRGVNPIDVEAAGRDRTQYDKIVRDLFHADEGKLREAIRTILREEIGSANVEFPSLEEYFSQRWLWTVNGSHNFTTQRFYDPEDHRPPGAARMFRRAYAECTSYDRVAAWNGKSFFSPSAKLEHGKSRAIFAGDTLTYFRFQHFLKHVEDVWTGKHVLLNPGRGGMYGMLKRIRGISAGTGVHTMMDYTDFNSAHTNASMRILFEEATSYVGYDPDMGALLANSFDNSYMVTSDGPRKIAGTLMSGHRATTFINSVLNRAYLLVVNPSILRLPAVHVGDDVYLSPPSLHAAAELMDDVRMSGLRMNPLKQSVGLITGEFLRMAFGSGSAFGYAPRAIASMISGNWTNSNELTRREQVENLVTTSWSLTNRCRNPAAAVLATTALSKRCGLSKCDAEALLNGTLALGSGPARAGKHVYKRVEIPAPPVSLIPKEVLSKLPSRATDDYLRNHTSTLERTALQLLGTSPKVTMLESSYAKTLRPVDEVPLPMGYAKEWMFGPASVQRGVSIDECRNRDVIHGALSEYPLIVLFKEQFTKEQLAILLRMKCDLYTNDVRVAAFGAEARGMVVEGWLPRADVQHASRRATEMVLSTSINLYF
ncbi:putative RNA-dependent RNA polymerase [Ustilaginoidea virens RNA virus 1]|uniref:putative RNA-dependent RNA polymerase n=1 Tax=Ustilaginoidea virens RNA virus 1 TaxID=1312445 RepID=UPI0002C69540|nr:putative RNA-dependent RNA polymerase [Ustilaginoidea virens RNA virus 1]AGI61065.1 putative RNA-dependent RNA polymerase [Ustilaginoidea virens RNA virus 1]